MIPTFDIIVIPRSDAVQVFLIFGGRDMLSYDYTGTMDKLVKMGVMPHPAGV